MMDDGLETYFAPAERLDDGELRLQVEAVSESPLVGALMSAVSGMLAVLNENRQIVAVNENLSRTLGIDNVRSVLGLRPGEAFECIHARECPGGCGTGRLCSTCGAAVAILTSLAQDRAAEKSCALTIRRGGKDVDFFFHVHTHPFSVDGRRFLLLFLRDETKNQRLAALERVFFHDINNMISALLNCSELLLDNVLNEEKPDRRLAETVHKLAQQIKRETEIQGSLSKDKHEHELMLQELSVGRVLQDLNSLFANHPVARGKRLRLETPISDDRFVSDEGLILRTLSNMLMNAFEASEEGDEVRLSGGRAEQRIWFRVWNKSPIPESVARRVFQRNFSTKNGGGRGLGTYSMKLFGEKLLNGEVDFETSESSGTHFYLRLPISPP